MRHESKETMFNKTSGDLIARKKITQCAKVRVLFKRTQIAVKTKTLAILLPNETFIIPK